MRSGTVENLHDFKGKLDKIKELKIFKKIYAVTLDKCDELPNNPVRVAGPMGQNESDEMKFWTKEEYMKFIPTMANKTYSYMAFESLMELIISLYLMRSIITSNLKKGNHSVEIRELEM